MPIPKRTTHELHNRCLAARRKLLTINPDIAAQAAAGSVTHGTPEHNLAQDLAALDAVALNFASGLETTTKQRRRVSAILVELGL